MPGRTLDRFLDAVLPHDGPADADLLARFARDQDEAAFGQLVRRHARLVLRVCRGVLRDHHAAEDCAQATFLALARQARSVTGGTVAGWLFRVARRTASRAARMRRPETGLDAVAADLSAPPAAVPLPQEAEAMLQEGLARLPEHYRVPVLLCFFDGLSHAAAARLLGCPVGTVNTRIARAKRLLARRLAARGLGVEVLGAAVVVPAAFVGTTVSLAAGRVEGVPSRVVELANYGGRMMLRDTLARAVLVLAVGGGLALGAAWAPAQRPDAPPPAPRAGRPEPVPPPRPTPAEVRDSAVKAITANYARLKTVRATVEVVNIDPGVTAKETTTSYGPNGSIATLTREPKTTRKFRLLLRGEEVRSDHDESGDVLAHTKGVWTEYVPAIKQAWLRRPDQMPGMAAFDPREAGSPGIRDRLLGRLGTDKLLRTGEQNSKTVIEAEGPAGQGVRYELDPSRNCLPTRVSYLHDDGSVNVVTDITYQEAIAGAVWFPVEATTLYYGEPGAKAGDRGWTFRSVLTVKDLKVNEPLAADAFEVPLPPGTIVSDAAGGFQIPRQQP